MELWMKILFGIAITMMLFAMWPAYKHWSTNSPKAEKRRLVYRGIRAGCGGAICIINDYVGAIICSAPPI